MAKKGEQKPAAVAPEPKKEQPESVRPVVNVVTLAAAARCSLGELKAGAKVPESDFQPGELDSLIAQGAIAVSE